MEVILNIDLARNGKPNPTIHSVLVALEANGFYPSIVETFRSDTEWTFVAVVDAHRVGRLFPVRQGLFNVSVLLEQECVAAYALGKGKLVGPKAAAWGAFNPELFILPDGTRLSEKVVAQAA